MVLAVRADVVDPRPRIRGEQAEADRLGADEQLVRAVADVVLGDRGAGEGHEDQEDDEDPARDRDLVAPEPDPDELPVASSANLSEVAEFGAGLGRNRRAEAGGTRDDDLFLFRRRRHLRGLRDYRRANRPPSLSVRNALPYWVRASAPATTSRISCVISAWRARFMSSVSDVISSPAFLDAFRIAVIRAPCSDAADSSRAR